MTDMADKLRAAVTPIQRAARADVLARGWHLGDLSERYESRGDPGTVSSGKNDEGGVSYGLYQLATKPGTAADFARNEGKPFNLVGDPGSAAFSASWKSAAHENRQAFVDAQRAYIRRSHYDPVIRTVIKATGVNLDAKCPAIRDACWSCAVQHRGAPAILIQAVHDVALDGRGDEKLLRAIYAERSAYVLNVAARTKSIPEADQLRSVVKNRYPDELHRALVLGGWA